MSAFSFLDGDVIAADPGSVGEGISISLRREHLFTPRAFTSLMVNQAIAKAFDGVRVLEPWVVYLKPMHENPELSWFETTGRLGADAVTMNPSRPRFRRIRAILRALKEAVRRGRGRPPQQPVSRIEVATCEAQDQAKQGEAHGSDP